MEKDDSLSRHENPNFEDFVIEKVYHSEEDSIGLSVRRRGDPEGVGKLFTLPVGTETELCEGDDIRIYDDPEVGLRGADVNGENLFYWSREEKRRYVDRQAKKRRNKERQKFEENREELDTRYGALPKVFRERIDRFRRNNPDFRWMFEDYELFVCEEAVKIAEAMETPEAVEEFREMSIDEQYEAVDLEDGHSGNTFSMATMLAYWYLKDPESVVKGYGALAPLVGSKKYGGEPGRVQETMVLLEDVELGSETEALIRTMLETGCRTAEVPKIEYCDGELYIPDVKGLAGVKRFYEPSPVLKELLDVLGEGKPFSDLTVRSVHRKLSMVAEEAGMDRQKLKPRNIRKDFVSELAEDLEGPEAVHLVQGHHDIRPMRSGDLRKLAKMGWRFEVEE